MPVKFFYAVRQQPHIPTADFQQAWREQVGPLVASLQHAARITRYVQLHRTPGDLDDGVRASRVELLDRSAPPYDIVDEYTFEGGLPEFLDTFTKFQELWQPVLELQSRFVDASTSSLGLVTEVYQVQTANGTIASPYNQLSRVFVTAEMDESGLEHWANDHASLVRRWSAAGSVHTYVQNQPRRTWQAAEVLGAMRQAWGIGVRSGQYACYATAIIEEGTSVGASVVSQQAGREIEADEAAGWQKKNTMSIMVGKEFIFVDKYRA